MKTRTLKLPPDLDGRLDEYAAAKGLNRSTAVREAIELYITSGEADRPHSVLARVHDLAGCLHGEPDLSTNDTYFAEYGETPVDRRTARKPVRRRRVPTRR